MNSRSLTRRSLISAGRPERVGQMVAVASEGRPVQGVRLMMDFGVKHVLEGSGRGSRNGDGVDTSSGSDTGCACSTAGENLPESPGSVGRVHGIAVGVRLVLVMLILVLSIVSCGGDSTKPKAIVTADEPGMSFRIGGRELRWDVVAQRDSDHPERTVITFMWHPGDNLTMEQVAVTVPGRRTGMWSLSPGVADEGQVLQYIGPDASFTVYFAYPGQTGASCEITVSRFEGAGGWIEGTFHGTCVEMFGTRTAKIEAGHFKVRNEMY